MNTNNLTLFIGTTPKKLKDIRPGLCVDEALNIIFKSEYSDKHGDDKDYEYLLSFESPLPLGRGW